MLHALTMVLLIFWSLFGIVYFWCAKPPKTRLGFFFNIILSGPFCWAVLGFTGIMVLNERRKINRGNEEYFNNSGEN